MIGSELSAEIASIGKLDLEGLRSQWARRYGAPLPLRSVPILRMLLAWRIQAQALGGLDADTRRALTRTGRIKAEGLALGIGARLTRHWQGKTHEVIVEADGFSWQGDTYSSLSAVATAIAGSRWNGPRVFGLRSAS